MMWLASSNLFEINKLRNYQRHAGACIDSWFSSNPQNIVFLLKLNLQQQLSTCLRLGLTRGIPLLLSKG